MTFSTPFLRVLSLSFYFRKINVLLLILRSPLVLGKRTWGGAGRLGQGCVGIHPGQGEVPSSVLLQGRYTSKTSTFRNPFLKSISVHGLILLQLLPQTDFGKATRPKLSKVKMNSFMYFIN